MITIFKVEDNTIYQFSSTSLGINCFLAWRLTSVLHDKDKVLIGFYHDLIEN